MATLSRLMDCLLCCHADMAPRILGPRNQLIRVIENNRTFLDCPFFGSPLPDLRW